MVLDIEPRLKHGDPSLKEKKDNFIQRVIVFSLSATCIIDLKTEVNAATSQSSPLLRIPFLKGLSSEQLCNFLVKLIL